MTPPLRIFIGWDSKEPVAFQVLASSILRRATIPVSIIPLTRKSLERNLYTRPRGQTEATEFSLTRFLVPYLSNYRGISVFMDCDMLCLVDIMELWNDLLPCPGPDDAPFGSLSYAVWCCQHDYVPRDLVKFDGHEQTKYPRKNWSSFLVFDNEQCKVLTPDYVNTATGLDLHRFHWLKDEQIGSLPLEWNHLVGEDNQSAAPPRIVHFTNGGPYFDSHASCDFASLWRDEYLASLAPALATERARAMAAMKVGV